MQTAMSSAFMYRYGNLLRKATSYQIGYSYEFGDGVEQNYSESLRFFTEASGKGSVVSLTAISRREREGKGVAKDEAKATVYLQLAEERGW
jgi:TPR repeat protein